MLTRTVFSIITPFAIRMYCSDFGYRSWLVGSILSGTSTLLYINRVKYYSPGLNSLGELIINPIQFNLVSSFCYNGMAHIILDDHVRSCVANAVTTFFIERNAGEDSRKGNVLIGSCSIRLFSAFIKYRGYHLILGERYFMPVLLDLLLRAIPIFIFAYEKDREDDTRETLERVVFSLFLSTISVARDCFYDFLLPLDTTSPIRWLLPDALIKGLEKYVDPYIAEFTFASPIER